jgi:hypothetical protein
MRHVGPRSRLSVYASSISLTALGLFPRALGLAPEAFGQHPRAQPSTAPPACREDVVTDTLLSSLCDKRITRGMAT